MYAVVRAAMSECHSAQIKKRDRIARGRCFYFAGVGSVAPASPSPRPSFPRREPALPLPVATNYRRQGPAGDYAECQSEMAGDWELGIGGLCTTCTTQRRPPQLGASSSRPGTRTRHSPLLTGPSLSLRTIAPLKIGVCNTGMALNRPPPS